MGNSFSNPLNTKKSKSVLPQEDTSVIISTNENKIHSGSNTSHTVTQQYQSTLDINQKRELVVYGYVRKYKEFYPKEIIQIIHNFYFIKILNYKIKGIGRNDDGQQGNGKFRSYPTLTTIKTFQKQKK
eukprot:248438_1